MKRLLAQIGIAFFSALAAAFYLNEKITFGVMFVCAVLAVIFFLIRKMRKTVYLPAIALAACAACLVNLFYSALVIAPVIQRYEGSHQIEAVLKDEPRKVYETYRYSLRVTSVDGEKAGFDLLLSCGEKIVIEPYDTLQLEGDLIRTEEQYRISKGYFLSCQDYAPAYRVIPNEKKPVWYAAISARRNFRKALETLLPADDAALCRAVLIGDKYALSEDIRSAFKLSGASYFIVVSGMHFSFFTLILTFLLKKIIKNRYVYIPAVIAFTLFYMAVTGFSFSVVRSGVMMLFYLCGQLFRRRVYPLNSLGAAGLVLPCLFSPCCAGDLGLILSFFATFSILMWSEPIYEKIRIKPKEGKKENHFQKAVNKLLRLLSATLAANILVFPISLFAFHAVSSLTLLSSIFLYVEIEGILLFSLAVCLLWLCPPLRFLARIFAWGLYFLCEALTAIVDFFSRLPFSYIRITEGFVYLWVLMTAALLLLAFLSKSGYRYVPLAAYCSLMILAAGMLTTGLQISDKPILKVYKSEGGMAVTLEEEGELYLLSCNMTSGERYRVLREIAEEYSRVPFALADSNIDRVALSKISGREFAISDILLYDKEQKEETYPGLICYRTERRIPLSDGTLITLYPAGESAIRHIKTETATVLILPDGCDVSLLPEEWRTADIAVTGDQTAHPELIYCDTLVLTADASFCEIQACALSKNCRRVFYTHENSFTAVLENSYAD